MEGAGGTASLRKAAPQWSLAGDKQLLDILQNLHERIVTKCQAANTSLDEMITALDTASISLQNVNNRFMALSNSQFVESRVYDDDVDVATQEAPVKEPPKPVDTTSELSKLKDSLRVLESYHEAVHILDSDSETGSDDEEDRMVFKPKDLYADRPLPYIIGSQKWRSKWHAGLMPEDSDTDSSTSKPEVPLEQYSDSEPEMDLQTDKPNVSQRTISTTSSIGSELTIPTVGKPADIAAELARRLGGNVPHVPEPEPEPEPEQIPSTSVPTKVYRPQQPTTATIFPDEPPPLDNYQSDSYQSESEEDVFAELHRKGRPEQKPAWKAVDGLFGPPEGGDGLRSEREPTPAKQSSPLFEDTQEPVFVEKTPTAPPADKEKQPDIGVKKPVGGISLFGNNKGTESIGAAILKRNQRKASTSDEETDIEPPQIINKSDSKEINLQTTANKNDKDINKTKEIIESKNSKDKTQKDIINDLFAKPSKKVEKAAQKVEKPVKAEAPAKKVDLFADDLFDDIDDIFSSNIKPSAKQTKETVKKSLFGDDDDDDLFASVAETSKKPSLKTEKKTKSIFDSDDDLFSDIKEEKNATKVDNTKTPTEISTKTLFEDKEGSVNSIITKSVSKSNNSSQEDKETKKLPEKSSIKSNKIKSIFDSDSDDDIFSDLRSNKSKSSLQKPNKVDDDVNKIKEETKKTETSYIDDFEKEDLFLTKEVQINAKNTDNRSQTINEKVIKTDEFVVDDESLFKSEKLSSIPKDNNVNNSTIDKNVVCIEKIDDDLFKKKKTDEVLEESIENTPETKINSVSYSEDELFSSKNIDISASNVKTSRNLSKSMVSNTQFNSPSLFDDDDDDMDSLFAKSITSTKPKKINTKSDKINFDSTLKQDPKDIESTENISALSVDDSENKIFDKSVNNKDTPSTFHVKSETDEIEAKIDNNSMSKSDIDSDSGANSNILSQNISDQLQESEGEVLRDENVINTPSTRGDSEVNFISTKHLEQEPNIQSTSQSESQVTIPKSIEKSISSSTSSENSKEPFAKDEFDDSIPVEKESVIPQQNDSKTDDNKTEFLTTPKEPDIFSDIFSDVPPEFERPKEPKKSKNVNALFDDDSDDETLFFKKNDVITDEKPDVNFGTQEDRLFHIFHDEPPAIDVDFTQKPTKTSQDKEIISWNTGPEIPNLDSKTDRNQEKTVSIKSEKIVEKESKDLIDEAKKPVGKLKPMNFNINVNTLLPGASPKKSKSNEQVDGQTISTNLEEVTKEPETKMIKSVSFEGDPDSEILDNKLSKERAKIQVKRRPSSRRARKEAVRKSGIDFGDDSTDNSSSTDISKKDDQVESKNDVLETRLSPTKDKLEKPKDTTVSDAVETSDKTQCKITNENSEKLSEEISKTIVEAVKSDNIKPNISENASLTSPYNSRSNVKSKVVYILNDEDIFNDAKPTKSKTLNIVDDDDELFKSSTSSNTKIPTLGNVYKNASTKQKDIDRIDSDEDIFKASMEKDKTLKSEDKIQSKNEIDQMEAKIDKLFVKSQNKPKLLFDDLSDDENELFGGRKSTKKPDVFESKFSSKDVKKEVKLPKVDVKGSLFGDDSDDDDLFGAKSAKSKEPTQSTPKPKDVISKPAEPVFEDPLTLLSQEDDF